MINTQKIRKLWLSTGLKEVAYAPLIGTSQQNFSNCLHGKRKFSKTLLNNIAQYHNCNLEDLYLCGVSAEKPIVEILDPKLSNLSMEFIKEITNQLEKMYDMQDKEIRDTFLYLMNLITYKDEGLFNQDEYKP